MHRDANSGWLSNSDTSKATSLLHSTCSNRSKCSVCMDMKKHFILDSKARQKGNELSIKMTKRVWTGMVTEPHFFKRFCSWIEFLHGRSNDKLFTLFQVRINHHNSCAALITNLKDGWMIIVSKLTALSELISQGHTHRPTAISEVTCTTIVSMSSPSMISSSATSM